MGRFFLDTSAVLKLYVREVGTTWLQGLIDPEAGHYFSLARITEAEVT